MRKFVLVINAYSARVGGGQTYILNLLENANFNEEVDIYVYAPASLEIPMNCPATRMYTRWPTSNPLLRALWERLFFPRVLRKLKADVLFCPGGVVATTPPKGCRTVTMFRNMIPFDDRASKSVPLGLQRIRNVILRRVLLRSMANADLTIFISNFARYQIERLAAVRNPVTIPHGINDRFRTHGRNIPRSPLAPAEEYLLYVSRFDVYKHHAELLDAYARLTPELRIKHPLVLAGEIESPCYGDVLKKIEEFGLAGQVRILGAVPYEQLPAMYHHARAVLFASSCENCPNILLEALGSGRPVLSSNVMPMPEFGGKDIIYFSPFDPSSIRAAIEEVLNSDIRSQQVCDAAVERSHAYDWAITARETWRHLLALGGRI